MLKLGSHITMASPDYFLGAVRQALEFKANAFMIYTGAPQNTVRVPVEKMKIEEGRQLWLSQGCSMDDVIIHAPYIINLGNCEKPETFQLAKDVLSSEIKRTQKMGARYIVVHPGASLKADINEAIAKIAEGLDEVLEEPGSVIIALETMAGKGTEVGRDFSQLRQIIDSCQHKDRLAVCLDSCHIHDGGYDLSDPDKILREFDEIIGLDRLKVIHINDSKNPCGAHKDRHANLGEGYIGFENILKLVNHPLLDDIPKILETPYLDSKPPYAKEIEMLRSGIYTPLEREQK